MRWARYGQLLGRHRGWLLLALMLMLLSLLASTVLLALSGWFISASALAGLGLLVGLNIFTPGAGIRLAAISRTLARYGERLASHAATLRLLTELRLDLFRRLLRLDAAQLDRLGRSDTLNRLTSDVDALNPLFAGLIGPTLAALLLSLALVLAVSLLAPLNNLIVLAVALGSLLALPLLTGMLYRLGKRPGRELVATLPRLRETAAAGIEGLDELRAFDRTEQQAQGIATASGRLGRLQQQLGDLDAIGQAAALLLVWLITLSVLLGGLQLHESGQLSGPLLVLAVLATLGLAEAWQGIPGAWRRLGQILASARRVDELADQSPSLSQAETAAAWPVRHQLSLSGVSFRYHPLAPLVLDRLDLEIAHGEQLLLSGASGIGKTSIALLLMRQHDPESGQVMVGGIDLKQLCRQDLERRMAWLPQRVAIFSDCLAANLRMGNPEASDEHLVEVLSAVGLINWLSELPDGLESWVDEDGANLSGGQRRRLALARLLLTDPDIALLDEPLAGLDPASTVLVSSALDRWLSGRTAVIISHDPKPLGSGRRHLKLQRPDPDGPLQLALSQTSLRSETQT
ncbi:MAG: thiol reductant ABC exporter subunit CydC [Wenzhouxiangella sp.]|nr:thiol reductant ABC exporter subunit CydC [Wenzhouxiangella sp.]MCH8477947.1 thiol reductant ABC exporter subunit CydC [Wenzhouxiangella sp.]TVR95853.1 MAG: thiol reductant ABC exporter subunit CydC [Wenzhouxiangellaceae bacterium]